MCTHCKLGVKNRILWDSRQGRHKSDRRSKLNIFWINHFELNLNLPTTLFDNGNFVLIYRQYYVNPMTVLHQYESITTTCWKLYTNMLTTQYWPYDISLNVIRQRKDKEWLGRQLTSCTQRCCSLSSNNIFTWNRCLYQTMEGNNFCFLVSGILQTWDGWAMV